MGDADFETINQKQLHEWTDTQEGLDQIGKKNCACQPCSGHFTIQLISSSSSHTYLFKGSFKSFYILKKKKKKEKNQLVAHRATVSYFLCKQPLPCSTATQQLLACVGVKLVYILVTDTNRAGELNVPGEAGCWFRTSCQFIRGVLNNNRL